MKFNKILFKQLMKENNLNQQKIADKLTERGEEISLAGVKQWTKNKNSTIPTFEKLKILGEIFKIEPLLLIENDIFRSLNLKTNIKAYDKYSNNTTIDSDLVKNLNTKYLRSYRVGSDFLKPTFRKDDILLIDLVADRKNFDKKNGLYLIQYEKIDGIQYLEFLDDGKINICHINKSKPILIEQKNIKIIAKVCDKIITEYKGL